MIEYRSGGRRVSQKQFFDGIKDKLMDTAMNAMEERVHAAASSIVDPETGRHAEVIVRRTGPTSFALSTQGSPAFARELERRLGIQEGEVQMIDQAQRPRVYLAHASEDHETLAKPLAEKLMANGVDVWLDAWEIQTGDSLRQKMEEGLTESTHFLVLLTPNSIGKAWVEREIDVGFVRLVSGKSRFLGIRCGVKVSDLSEFLQTLRCPALDVTDDGDVAGLVADIHGASRKPVLGTAPRYAKAAAPGLANWSSSALAVAEHLVRASKVGRVFDPQTDIARVAEATGLPEADVRLGVLDLADAGFVERSRTFSSESFWPKAALFVEFDRHFMDFDNQADAGAIANLLVNEEIREIGAEELAKRFPDWGPRRLNSAIQYLEAAKAIAVYRTLNSGPWAVWQINTNERTLKFVRNRS